MITIYAVLQSQPLTLEDFAVITFPRTRNGKVINDAISKAGLGNALKHDRADASLMFSLVEQTEDWRRERAHREANDYRARRGT